MNTTAIPQENNCRDDNFDDFSEISIEGLLPEFGGREAVLGFECFAEGGFGFIADRAKEEITEALGVAISVNAGAALVYPPASWMPLKLSAVEPYETRHREFEARSLTEHHSC